MHLQGCLFGWKEVSLLGIACEKQRLYNRKKRVKDRKRFYKNASFYSF